MRSNQQHTKTSLYEWWRFFWREGKRAWVNEYRKNSEDSNYIKTLAILLLTFCFIFAMGFLGVWWKYFRLGIPTSYVVDATSWRELFWEGIYSILRGLVGCAIALGVAYVAARVSQKFQHSNGKTLYQRTGYRPKRLFMFVAATGMVVFVSSSLLLNIFPKANIVNVKYIEPCRENIQHRCTRRIHGFYVGQVLHHSDSTVIVVELHGKKAHRLSMNQIIEIQYLMKPKPNRCLVWRLFCIV